MFLLRRIIQGLTPKSSATAAASSTTRPKSVIGDSREHYDLTGHFGLTNRLLDDAYLWRQRGVHRFNLADSDHVDAQSSYQVKLPLELVRKAAPAAKKGDLVMLDLPLTTRQKQLLLDVRFSHSDGERMTLLLREENANFVGRYLTSLSGTPPLSSDYVLDLWHAIGRYMPDDWRFHRASVNRRMSGREARLQRGLAHYLAADLGFGISSADIRYWRELLRPAEEQIAGSHDFTTNLESPAECILLAIPFMSYKPHDADSIKQLVIAYVAMVDSMTTHARGRLAHYSHRWPVLVTTRLPIEEPVTVHLSEKLPWEGAPGPTLKLTVPFNDAKTTHLEISAADPGIVITKPEALDRSDSAITYKISDAVREAVDTAAIYAADRFRPEYATFVVSAKAPVLQRVLVAWLLVLILLACVITWSMPTTSDNLPDTLSVVAFPLTLGGAVVLTRETTPLGERLLRRWRFTLMGGIALLWLLALWKLSAHHGVEPTPVLSRTVEYLHNVLPLGEPVIVRIRE